MFGIVPGFNDAILKKKYSPCTLELSVYKKILFIKMHVYWEIYIENVY